MLRNIGWQLEKGAMRGKIEGAGPQMSVGEGRKW
jgi:hypothetical protein